MKRPAAREETEETPAKKTRETPKDEEEDPGEEEEPEEEEQEEEEEPEKAPEKSPEPPEPNSKLAKVKGLWRPRFEALAKKDPRLVLDHGVLSSDNNRSWTVALKKDVSKFNPYSGCFYIYDAKQKRLDMVNRKYGTAFEVNLKDGASLGWTKFASLDKAPGAWHFATVADLSQLAAGVESKPLDLGGKQLA
ncbi:unnamed protein product [Symbiodinium necroappetens]|uniref:Uncharacterized protein n=1 Tax=Symbiodinium necroappetens TaxID=1628268 RepID=A0A813AR19_9DINO|nr:unnamed protein product [Symbiodinium necroappetens]